MLFYCSRKEALVALHCIALFFFRQCFILLEGLILRAAHFLIFLIVINSSPLLISTESTNISRKNKNLEEILNLWFSEVFFNFLNLIKLIFLSSGVSKSLNGLDSCQVFFFLSLSAFISSISHERKNLVAVFVRW